MKEGQNNQRKKRQRKQLIALICVLSVVLAALVALLAVLLFTEPEEVQGNWIDGNGTTYRFNGKGKGMMFNSENLGKFTYEISGNTLRIDFARDNIPDKIYTFTLEDDVLTLKSGDETLVLHKK